VGKNGAFLNTGIPGTGIYDRTKIGGGKGGNAGVVSGSNSGTASGASYEAQDNGGKMSGKTVIKKVIGVFLIILLAIPLLLMGGVGLTSIGEQNNDMLFAITFLLAGGLLLFLGIKLYRGKGRGKQVQELPSEAQEDSSVEESSPDTGEQVNNETRCH